MGKKDKQHLRIGDKVTVRLLQEGGARINVSPIEPFNNMTLRVSRIGFVCNYIFYELEEKVSEDGICYWFLLEWFIPNK